jgi:mannose-6-phosphate isomerase-like protein (cupin superfamily)
MFSSSIERTIRPHLRAGEELLAAVMAQAAGANAQLMAHAVGTPVAASRADVRTTTAHEHAQAVAAQAGIGLDRRMVLAVTSERLLVFKAGGAFTVKVRALVGEAPVEDVDAIAVAPDGRLTKAVTLHVRGAAIGVETARGQPAEDLPAGPRPGPRPAHRRRPRLSPPPDPETPPMSHAIAHTDELDREGPWLLARRTLGVRSLGINVVDVAPGGSLPAHDETESAQEEVYLVLSGRPTIRVGDREHEAPAGTFVRLDPEPIRSVVNRGTEPARLLMVSAPTSSGFTPMDWS